MKIFAVVHNYPGNENASPFGTGKTVWYEMSESCVLRSGNPFFVPDFDPDFSVHPSVVYRIGRLGKNIAPRFASRYLEAAGAAAAVVARDSLKALRNAGLPWSAAVSFDRSCFIGNLKPIDAFINKTIDFSLGDSIFSYDLRALSLPVEEVVALLSRNNTLKNGDLILAAIAPEGFSLVPGNRLVARDNTSETNFLEINIK